MARPREFDEELVLDRATEVFRSAGYDAATVSDIEEAVGLGRQSIYNVYGDKLGLFLRVLERYNERGLAIARMHLDGPHRGLAAINSYLDELTNFLTEDSERRGCLMARSLMDAAHEEDAVAKRCSSNINILNRLFAKTLMEAIEDGELAGSIDPRAAASILSTHTYGLSAMIRAGASRRSVKQSTRLLLDQLKKK